MKIISEEYKTINPTQDYQLTISAHHLNAILNAFGLLALVKDTKEISEIIAKHKFLNILQIQALGMDIRFKAENYFMDGKKSDINTQLTTIHENNLKKMKVKPCMLLGVPK